MVKKNSYQETLEKLHGTATGFPKCGICGALMTHQPHHCVVAFSNESHETRVEKKLDRVIELLEILAKVKK